MNSSKNNNNGKNENSSPKKKTGLLSSLYNSAMSDENKSSSSRHQQQQQHQREQQEQQVSNQLSNVMNTKLHIRTNADSKELDLLRKKNSKTSITVEDVLKLNKYTENYLCDVSDNIYQIEFVRFKIRDVETDLTLFEVAKSPEDDKLDSNSDGNDDQNRFVRYNFASAFLRLKTVGATVEFTVGDKPVKNFCMIERHYFKDKLLKNFEFNFGFCMPNSRNTMEHIYQFPTLSESTIQDMIASPFETRSDTFYFVENKLIMHNKADYAYNADYI